MLLTLHKFAASPTQLEAKNIEHRDLIFIHGTGSSAQMWQPQVELLTARGHRCYVVDLRGHGQTAEPGEHTDLAVHAADMIQTLEASDVRLPAIFVGHSLGAILSVTLAEQKPHMVALVFAAGFPGKVLKPVTLAFKYFMQGGYQAIKQRNMHQNWAFRPRTLIATEKHALDQIVANFGDLDFVTNAPKVQCPVHIAAGRFDPVAPSFYAAKVHKAIPGSTFKMFEFGGHNFMDTHPKTFNQWLTDGLDDFENTGAEKN